MDVTLKAFHFFLVPQDAVPKEHVDVTSAHGYTTFLFAVSSPQLYAGTRDISIGVLYHDVLHSTAVPGGAFFWLVGTMAVTLEVSPS